MTRIASQGNRITQQQLETYLWGAATLLRGTIDAGDYKQFIFPLIFYKRLCDVFNEEIQNALAESGGDRKFALYPENHRFQIPADAQWSETRTVAKNVGQTIQNAMRAIETANPDKLYGIFGDAQWTNKDRLPDAMLRDLIEHFSSLDLTVANLPEDELGNGYEYLIKKFADDSGHTAAEFYTNRTVVHLMTEMLEPQPAESIYDPTCGSGGMLLSCVAHLRRKKKEWRNVKLYGQERNLMTSSIARMNCFLHGIEDFRIERGDTLAEPKLVDGDRLQRFDVVLANPPYSIKQWNREAFAADPWGRNVFGVPPQGRADYAFQQHILQSLKPKTGRCAALWPHGILFRNEEDDIRRKFIESDYIEAVIGLGPNLFYNSSMQSCIVVCRTKKTPKQRNKILFIDASNEVTRERTQSFLAPDHLNNILQSYREFSSSAGFATVATLEEIKANDWSLNIPLYVKTTGGNDKSDASESKGNPDAALEAWMDSAHAGRLALTALLPALATDGHARNFRPSTDRFIQSLDRKSWRKVQLAEVCEEISIRVDNPALSGQSRFVGLEHFDSGELKIRRWGTTESLESSMKAFSSGDVLFARRNAYLKRASLADFEGLCSGDAIVLREKHEVIVPGFLAFILNTNRFWEFAIANAAGTMSRRVNGKTLMRFEFDLPPLDHQGRFAEILWTVDMAEKLWTETLAALELSKNSLVESFISQASKSKPPISLVNGCIRVTDGTHQPPTFTDTGIPFFLVKTISSGFVDWDRTNFVSEESYQELTRRFRPKRGDILYTAVGATYGVALEVDFDNPFVFQRHIAHIIPNPEVFDSTYLSLFLNSPHGKRQSDRAAIGSAQPTVTLKSLSNFEIACPSLSEQKYLAQSLRSFSEASNAIKLLLKNFSTIRNHFLSRIFS